MDQRSYQRLLAQLEGLTPQQAAELGERLQRQQAQRDTWRVVEQRLQAHAACPHCEGEEIVKFGHSGASQRYRCKGCGKTFTALTGTPFVRLRDKDKLLANAACMAEGLSIRKTAAKLGISVKQAFRWRHRFLSYLSEQQPAAMTGVVEADETFFPLSFKGQRQGLPRPPKKRGGKPKRKADDDDDADADADAAGAIDIESGSFVACSPWPRRKRRMAYPKRQC